MPKFDYIALDSKGKETKGTMDVASQKDALDRLNQMGLHPTSVKQAAEAAKAGGKGAKGGKKKK